ncbi:hypothetical protein STANM309S_00751 [Streptomyces tanashiensis]
MQDEYAWLLEQLPKGRPVPSEVTDIRWMIEELRVSDFAHALGTAYPVSDKRIVKARRGGPLGGSSPWVSSTSAPPAYLSRSQGPAEQLVSSPPCQGGGRAVQRPREAPPRLGRAIVVR